MGNDLLVTLADKNYIDQAKQLFSSVYFNAGWKGDYMLLSYEIPGEDLQWFRNKGISIKECKPLYDRGIIKSLAIDFNKLYLFTPEFKKWKNIVYLDADAIVRASLDELTKVKGFAAVRCFYSPELRRHFTPLRGMDEKLFSRLEKSYSLKSPAFNAGLMAFSTDIIKGDTVSRLKELFDLYREIIIFNDQPIFNLFFCKRWVSLPSVYNINPTFLINMYGIKPEKVKGIILHFPGPKPWESKGYFYKEWVYNLEKAELIDLNKIQNPLRIRGIKRYCLYLEIKHMGLLLDRYIGLIGVFLKNNFPKLYFKLKKLKKVS